ncbi:hypothetical protein Tco_0925720 [Tanacetum coccineum]|uniref:Uncharacterized protein n=1 Tax=Tanacetum coccineum TaxID=301880 RepID=A0ABQ5D7N0_9ASTR
MDMDAPAPQDMSYVDHVKQRKEEKGCLFACLGNNTFLCVSYAVYLQHVAASVALRRVSAAWILYAVMRKERGKPKGILTDPTPNYQAAARAGVTQKVGSPRPSTSLFTFITLYVSWRKSSGEHESYRRVKSEVLVQLHDNKRTYKDQSKKRTYEAAADVDIDEVARRTKGYSGDDLINRFRDAWGSVSNGVSAMVLPKFDMHIYTSILTAKELKEAIAEYCIPTDLHPHLPPPELTMNKLLPWYIGIYMEQLEQGGLRIPFSTFFLALCKQGHWFSIENKTGGRAKKCFKEVTSSLKGWKKKFFLIDRRAIPDVMPWRNINTDFRDDFPTNYNKGDAEHLAEFVIPLHHPLRHLLYVCGLTTTCRHPKLSYSIKDPDGKGNQYDRVLLSTNVDLRVLSYLHVLSYLRFSFIFGVLTMDAFMKLPVWNGTVVSKGDPIPDSHRPSLRTTPPLEAGKLILEKILAQRDLEKPNSKIASAREKKEQQNLAKAQAKRTGERGLFAPWKKRVRKNQEIIGSGSEGTVSTTPLHHAAPKLDATTTATSKDTTGNPSVRAEHEDAQDNVVFPDGQCILSQGELLKRHEQLNHDYVDLRNRSDAHLGDLDRLRTELQREMQANDRLSKKFALLDNAHSSCLDREMELLDRLKDMERKRGLEADCLRTEKTTLVTELAQAEMDHHKLVREVIPTVVKRLHTSVEYQKSLATPVSLCFTVGWLGGLSLGCYSYRLPVDALMKVSPDVPSPASNDVTGPSTETTTGTSPKMTT